MFTRDAAGKRVYTLNKVVKNHKGVSEVTKSAHPARFSPDDKYSRYVFDSPPYKDQKSMDHFTDLNLRYRHRVTIKKRYALLLTQAVEEKKFKS